MAQITINQQQFDVQAGRPLVEVIKDLGFYISNLCYIDGLPPYAGCRTCVVEIEGVRGLPLACSTPVTDGMVVRTDTPPVQTMRQEVMAIILANHSDRCLSCHRVEHCKTGEICLRDNVVTHRCVTCSKNYRCELQTASDLADMGRANVEPYLDEARSYYQDEQPPPDRANPFLEFDPQMCIICTRCVRACDEIRHTTAISLAGRGFSTRIAFGSGGPIDESNCDFCGACIDVCPTATLMEAPNKWIARPERWTHTVCTECAIGCTIQMGVRNGRGVIVRPGGGNDVSRDQICVRGRFGYDQVRDKHRLQSGRIGRGDAAVQSAPDAVRRDFAQRLQTVIERDGLQAVALLGSAIATNEENYLLRQLADAIGTPHLDSSAGYIDGPVAAALAQAFGRERLPSRLTDLETAQTLVVIADDLESSHNIAALRVKDAVVKCGATLVSIAPRANEVDDFAAAVLRARDGDTAALVRDLIGALAAEEGVRAAVGSIAGAELLPAAPAPGEIAAAAALLAPRRGEGVAVVFAPSRHSAQAATTQAAAAIDLAILLAGPERAAASLHLLPADVNAVGLRDMGVVPQDGGLDLLGILRAAKTGQIKAMIIAKDNPVMTLPHSAGVREALSALDLCLVIDDVPTDTVALATHVLPDVAPYAKDGTITTADRQILRLRPALRPQPQAQPLEEHLSALAHLLADPRGATAPTYAGPAAAMEEIARTIPGYETARYPLLVRGARQPATGEGEGEGATRFLPLAPPARNGGPGLILLTGRDLYTDREAAAAHLPDADRLQRSAGLEIHPRDAAARQIGDGDPVELRANGTTIRITARVSEAVPEGALFLAALWDAGAAQALLPQDAALPRVDVRRSEAR